MTEVPEGFAPLEGASGFVNLVGPFYYKEIDSGIVIGLMLEDRHCNSTGTAHGGLISTMADIALGKSIGFAKFSPGEFEKWSKEGIKPKHALDPIVTINLSTDFTGIARANDWIEMKVDIQSMGKTLSFASAYLDCAGKRIASSSGIYRNLG